MPQIGVIVPVYKVEQYLSRCVESILNQTFRDFELILVNDGSPDRCGAMCDEYADRDCRIHVIHRENGGLSAARNTGIEWVLANSDSKYLTFVDSDDWLHPQCLEILIHAIGTECAGAAMVGRDYVSHWSADFPHWEVLPEPVLYEGETLFLSREWDFNYAWGKLYRREHFSTLRYPEGKNFEDVFTTYQVLFSCGKTALVDEPLYYYYRNHEGISHSAWKPGELVIFEGMRQQMAFYQENGFDRAFAKEEQLYVNHYAYQLTRIRENRADWEKNKPIWHKLRREMLDLMQASNGKYTYKSMPQCYTAAHPHMARAIAQALRPVNVWKRYGFTGMFKKVKEKLGG